MDRGHDDDDHHRPTSNPTQELVGGKEVANWASTPGGEVGMSYRSKAGNSRQPTKAKPVRRAAGATEGGIILINWLFSFQTNSGGNSIKRIL